MPSRLWPSINEFGTQKNIGTLVMYNLWSIISCINKSGRFDVYWVNTGNHNLIEQKILVADADIKESFKQMKV